MSGYIYCRYCYLKRLVTRPLHNCNNSYGSNSETYKRKIFKYIARNRYCHVKSQSLIRNDGEVTKNAINQIKYQSNIHQLLKKVGVPQLQLGLYVAGGVVPFDQVNTTPNTTRKKHTTQPNSTIQYSKVPNPMSWSLRCWSFLYSPFCTFCVRAEAEEQMLMVGVCYSDHVI